MTWKWIWIVRWVLFTVLTCVLFCLAMGAAKVADGGTPPEFGRDLPPGVRRLVNAPTDAERGTVQRHLGVSFRMADASLEVREQVDFLLTPALLVQEAVSDGVILTYPEE
jgi:hypothetical protein